MDYGQIYSDLVQRGLDRTLDNDVYVERHHVWPKCMGGPDEESNIVKFTAEEHFLAHQLLVKMFPDNHKLVYACKAMSMNSNGRVSMKMYGWIRRKLSNARTGKKHSQETCRKISESKKGKTAWNKGKKGKTPSDETRRKISETNKGREFSQETRIKIAESNKGKNVSDETRRKMSEAGKLNWAKRKQNNNLHTKY